jgi:hypothetical protein
MKHDIARNLIDRELESWTAVVKEMNRLGCVWAVAQSDHAYSSTTPWPALPRTRG